MAAAASSKKHARDDFRIPSWLKINIVCEIGEPEPVTFDISPKCASMNNTLGNYIEELCMVLELSASDPAPNPLPDPVCITIPEDTPDSDAPGVAVPIMDAETFAKVLEFCQIVEAQNRPDDFKKWFDQIGESAWEKEFVASLDDAMLFSLVLGANWLGNKELLDVTCKAISRIVRDMDSTDEILTRFGIVKTAETDMPSDAKEKFAKMKKLQNEMQ